MSNDFQIIEKVNTEDLSNNLQDELSNHSTQISTLQANFAKNGKHPQLIDVASIVTGKQPEFTYNVSTYDTLVTDATYNATNVINFGNATSHILRTNFKARVLTYTSGGVVRERYEYTAATLNFDGSYSYYLPADRPYARIGYKPADIAQGVVPLATLEENWGSSIDATKYGDANCLSGVDVPDKAINITKLDQSLQTKLTPIISTNPCEYTGNEICMLYKGICVGDSLTAGTFDENSGGSTVNFVNANLGYVNNLSRMTGLTLTNLGRGGTTCKTWYEYYTVTSPTDMSGHDFAIIALGVNDGYSTNGWTAESGTYLTNIVTKLRADNANIKIFIATPPLYFNGTKFDGVRAGIRTLAASLSLYLLDFGMYLTDMTYDNRLKYAVTAYGHFNAYGYYYLAKAYKSYISYIIKNNIDAFKNLQFVGTSYSWT